MMFACREISFVLIRLGPFFTHLICLVKYNSYLTTALGTYTAMLRRYMPHQHIEYKTLISCVIVSQRLDRACIPYCLLRRRHFSISIPYYQISPNDLRTSYRSRQTEDVFLPSPIYTRCMDEAVLVYLLQSFTSALLVCGDSDSERELCLSTASSTQIL